MELLGGGCIGEGFAYLVPVREKNAHKPFVGLKNFSGLICTRSGIFGEFLEHRLKSFSTTRSVPGSGGKARSGS